MSELTAHPIADKFPMMDSKEFDSLVESIRERGQREPIVLWEGKILDGRNRYKACKQLGIDPRTRQFPEGESPWLFAWDCNAERRHLEKGRIAHIKLDILDGDAEWQAEQKKITDEGNAKRAAQTRSSGRFSPSQLPGNCDGKRKGGENKTRKARAEKAGVGPGTMALAETIKKNAPDLHVKVRDGELSQKGAYKELRQRKHAEKVEEIKATPTPLVVVGPYDIILADPPWRYDFSETSERAIENHYGTATQKDICAQKPDAEKDSILFLWATAPKLLEALEVMNAWGFSYKTQAVWDKETMGMGYWFRGQHEILMVGTKGKVSPPQEFVRVSSVFRERKGKHSKKPAAVYEWIERAFPDSKKLEMYCREPRKGWGIFGNEVGHE